MQLSRGRGLDLILWSSSILVSVPRTLDMAWYPSTAIGAVSGTAVRMLTGRNLSYCTPAMSILATNLWVSIRGGGKWEP
jgi:hypothetical protein